MKKQARQDYSRLISAEINSYLSKIYKKMKQKLKPVKIMPENLLVKHVSVGATKMWEFKLNSREEAAKGNIGSIIIATRGLQDSTIRRQRALFIAAELYVYHAFANHPNPKHFSSIKCQNQYWDMTKKLFGARNAHELRDQAVRYVIEEVKEHKLAHSAGKGWIVSIAKLKTHHPEIAKILGSSEKTFKKIIKKQHQKFSHAMLLQEEDLVQKEIEDIDHISSLLKKHEKKKHPAQTRKLIKIHLTNLKTFRTMLVKIRENIDKWVVVDKKKHKQLRKKKKLPLKEQQKLLAAEAKAEKIDINMVHLVFKYFEKEKINILKDLELIDKIKH